MHTISCRTKITQFCEVRKLGTKRYPRKKPIPATGQVFVRPSPHGIRDRCLPRGNFRRPRENGLPKKERIPRRHCDQRLPRPKQKKHRPELSERDSRTRNLGKTTCPQAKKSCKRKTHPKTFFWNNGGAGFAFIQKTDYKKSTPNLL